MAGAFTASNGDEEGGDEEDEVDEVDEEDEEDDISRDVAAVPESFEIQIGL